MIDDDTKNILKESLSEWNDIDKKDMDKLIRSLSKKYNFHDDFEKQIKSKNKKNRSKTKRKNAKLARRKNR